MLLCDYQDEIDSFWSKLSADPEAEQCGWLKTGSAFPGNLFPALWMKRSE